MKFKNQKLIAWGLTLSMIFSLFVGLTPPKKIQAMASKVTIAGDFNEWNTSASPIENISEGLWEGSIVFPESKSYEYKAVVNEKDWYGFKVDGNIALNVPTDNKEVKFTFYEGINVVLDDINYPNGLEPVVVGEAGALGNWKPKESKAVMTPVDETVFKYVYRDLQPKETLEFVILLNPQNNEDWNYKISDGDNNFKFTNDSEEIKDIEIYFDTSKGYGKDSVTDKFPEKPLPTDKPKLSDSSIKDGATDVLPNISNIDFVFHKGININDSNKIAVTPEVLFNTNIVNDNTLRISLEEELKTNTNYNIILEEGAIKDSLNNVNEKITLSFTTSEEFIKTPLINDDGTVTFYAKYEGENLYLVGSMNAWDNTGIDMEKNEEGLFEVTIPLEAGYYEYKFNTVSGEWKDDFIDPFNPNKVGGNSYLYVPGLISDIPQEVSLGDSITLEAKFLNSKGEKEIVTPTWTLEEEIEGISLEGNKLEIGQNVNSNTDITIIGTYDKYTVKKTIKVVENMYTYKIHYFRYDDKELDWDMWIWEDGKEGNAYSFDSQDENSFAISTLKFVSPKINLITRPGDWSEQEKDRIIEIPNGETSVEVWIVEGDTNIYYEVPDTSKKVINALMDSKTEIIGTTTHKILEDNINATLKDIKNNEEILVTANKIGDKRFKVEVEEPVKIDVKKVYELSIDGFKSSKVTMRNILNDKEYYYDGDDLGLVYTPEASTFKVWAPTAKKVSLALYDDEGVYNTQGEVEDHTGGRELEMNLESKGVWAITVEEDLESKYYMYKVEFADGTVNYAIDPYAKAVSANGQRGAIINLDSTDPSGFNPFDKPDMINPTDAILYELHVRDFSIDENSDMEYKGKFKAFTEKGTSYNGTSTGIEHLKELGITHVHLLPSYDFKTVNELTVDNPNSNDPKFNWGYDPQNYNVPEGSYSTDPSNPSARIKEFKEMVKALHDNGIRVIMDVVYNHTYEIENGPFNKIVPGYYYRTDDNGKFTNGSGCGNEVASERPMVRKFIKDSVKYWATEYGVDGFRFDLMGLIDVDTMEQITRELHNEIDSTILIYGEPWTAGGSPLSASLQTTKGAQKDKDFAVFNDNIRNAIRSANGNGNGKDPGFATGATGQEQRVVEGIKGAINDFTNSPTESINYVAAHDNLNIWDKVMADIDNSLDPNSTIDPHSIITEENPLENEGVRRSLLANGIVFTSQGIPFIHAGDEFLRSKYGDHNSYKSSDDINKIRWELKDEYKEVFEYYKGLINLRKNHPAFRMTTKEDVNNNLEIIRAEGNVIAFKLKDFANGDTWKNIVVIYNANTTKQSVILPEDSSLWNIVVDETGAGDEVLRQINGNSVEVAPLSMMVLYDEADDYESIATSIEIEEDMIGIEVGDSKILTAVVRDQKGRVMLNQNITWTSDNETIVKVENGKIKALSEGKAIITASLGELKDTVEINVAKLEPTQINISGQNLVYENMSIQLKADVYDQFNQKILEPNIVWSSSDDSIAKVDNDGKILGITPGKVVITAKSGNAKAEKEITVKKYEQRVIELKYIREDKDYTDWNLWVWGTGTEDVDQIDFTEITDEYAKVTIKVAPGVESVGFIVRKGTDWETAKQDIQEDRFIVLDPEEVVTKVVITSMVKEIFIVPSIEGPITKDGNITFYYRDEELYKNNKMDTIEKAEVVINGTAYEMNYDSKNEYFEYTLENVPEGTYEYVFRVTKDGKAVEIPDPKNINSQGKSIIEILKLNLDINAKVTPEVVDYNQNALLSLDIRNSKTNEAVNVKEISVNLSSVGGNSSVSVPTNLNAISIAISQKTTEGLKKLPIEIVDEYGTTHIVETELEVRKRDKINENDFDWDEAVIYFMLTDRFNDGDKSNNDPYNLGDYDPNMPGAYHGGDFKGVTEKLDYLKELGINTIWITPIVENIKYDVRYNEDPHITPFYGYHGYWASNFEELNPHLGTIEDFHELIDKAHEKGIKIMVDVVLNHSGYGLKESDANVTGIPGYPTDEERNRFKGMLRENPVNGDEIKGELSGLPDFVTEDQEVRDQIIKWQVAWVNEIGRTPNGNTIDYFRVDTVKHVQDDMLIAFKNELTKVYPEFKMIGEAFGASMENDLGDLGNGKMDSLLDFNFKERALSFVNGNIDRIESYLENRNEKLDNNYTFGNFLGSHDEDGFLTRIGNDKNKLKIAASLQATAKGQPVIYYGEELGLSGLNNYPYNDNRYDMQWDMVENNDVLEHYKKVFNARQEYLDVFAKGTRKKLAGSNKEEYLVFERNYNDESVVVGLNLGEEKEVKIPVPFEVGTEVKDLYSSLKYIVAEDNTITVNMPAIEKGGTIILTKQIGTNPEEPNQPEDPQGDGEKKSDDSNNSSGSSSSNSSKNNEKEDVYEIINKAKTIYEALEEVSSLDVKAKKIDDKKVIEIKEEAKKAIENAEKALKVFEGKFEKEDIYITFNVKNVEEDDKAEVLIKENIIKQLEEKNIGINLNFKETSIILAAKSIENIFLEGAKEVKITKGFLDNKEEIKQDVIKNHSEYQVYGDIFDLGVVILDDKGKEIQVKELNEAVKIRTTLDQSIINNIKDIRKAGVYYINDNGSLEFIGGKFEDNIVSFDTDILKPYVVIEYNKTFADIQNHWGKEYIEVLAARHIAKGMDENQFNPNNSVTRGEMATFIGRVLRLNKENYNNSFSDIKEDEYYYEYILALKEKGIIGGYPDGTFRPKEEITREQMLSMIMSVYRYLENQDLEEISGYDEVDIPDIDQVSEWAKESVKAGKALGIVDGVGEGKINPKGIATRAEVSKMIIKLMEITDQF